MGFPEKVVFVGGIHGSGKTTLCGLLSRLYKGGTNKQFRALVEIGEELGIGLEAVVQLGKYVGCAAERVFEIGRDRGQKALFIDSHYSMRKDKALRSEARLATDEYIADLDHRFVRALAANISDVSFILIKTDPDIAHRRICERTNITWEEDYAVEALSMLCEWEDYYFKVMRDNIQSSRSLVVSNNYQLTTALAYIQEFIGA